MLKDVAPLIIPRKEHGISRKQVSENALRTLYRLHSRGFIAHLVGGCVRDLLLGRTPKDFDIATNAMPGQIKRLFRNCFLVGRRFRLAHLHFQNEILEVSTFRRAASLSDDTDREENQHTARHHVKNEEGMLLADNLFGTPEEDALRRDFTINALAYDIADFSVIDYTTGLADLEARLIRPIGDPHIRFTEDPVRMLRAVRFAASHNFTVEPEAWRAICELSPTISRASPARLYEEVQKLFLVGHARPAFRLLNQSGLLAALFPALSRWMAGEDSRIALLDRRLESLDRACASGKPPSPALFLAALFGPSLEEEALARHREGVPFRQALDLAGAELMKGISATVSIPGRAGNGLRAIVGLQPSLHRMPPRRPALTAGKPEFPEALAYLALTATTGKEYQDCLAWWESYQLNGPPAPPAAVEVPPGQPRKKRARRRRRTRHRKKKGTAGGTEDQRATGGKVPEQHTRIVE